MAPRADRAASLATAKGSLQSLSGGVAQLQEEVGAGCSTLCLCGEILRGFRARRGNARLPFRTDFKSIGRVQSLLQAEPGELVGPWNSSANHSALG